MNKVSITINSRHYNVVAEESVEYIQSLGEHINEKVQTVLGSGTNVMGERPIVLAALNICDEYFKALEAGNTINEQIKRYNEKIEELQNANKKLQSKVSELSAEIEESKSDQISMDVNEVAVKELQDKLEKAENRIKILENQVKQSNSKWKR